jgi:hypothetical protein
MIHPAESVDSLGTIDSIPREETSSPTSEVSELLPEEREQDILNTFQEIAFHLPHEMLMQKAATTIQAYYRSYKDRQAYKRNVCATSIIGRSMLRWRDRVNAIAAMQSRIQEARKDQERQQEQAAATKLQTCFRSITALRGYQTKQDAIRVIQQSMRRWTQRAKLRMLFRNSQLLHKQERNAATTIQTYMRRHLIQREFMKMKEATRVVESFGRRGFDSEATQDGAKKSLKAHGDGLLQVTPGKEFNKQASKSPG